MAQLIDGKALARGCRKALKERVQAFSSRKGYPPGLGVILVGDDPASRTYVRNKERMCEKIGIESFHNELPADVDAERVAGLIDDLNGNQRVHGILLQLPLPDHIPSEAMLQRILPEKDADGFHPLSAGLLAIGEPRFLPCTPKGIMRLIATTDRPVKGARAVVVGRSNIVGKPVAQLLLREHATVTICHSRTADLPGEVGRADILVAAIGRAELVRGEWIKNEAVVIDVGMNRREDGTLCGDVEFDVARERASWITPVPGGVGPMTVAMLLENTVEAAERHDR
ncbi:MAG: bifunctional methylenetetrahydrofolate dehydrogenase/methenyltetrahydrofolate cyclohydrolase FolD [Planctomycetota bacterium]